VRQLKSGKKAMDAVMQDAMKQSTHPKIQYKVLELKPKGATTGGKAEFDAKGVFTVAGVMRTNVMPVTVERVDPTKLKVTGITALKMTDFGIKPPSPDIPGGGLIKTGDDVKISFEWMPEVEKK
jgi:polyisoprenoid-binding protein YceI